MPTVNLSSPWVILYHEIEAMFKKDKGVKVVLDNDTHSITLYVENSDKAAALSAILIPEKHFGNVTAKVTVVPANKTNTSAQSIEETFKVAFKGSDVLSYVIYADLPLVNQNVYIVFKNEVVQYFNDDLMDVNGFCSTLYQEIAKDIFLKEIDRYRLCYCTDTAENIGRQLKEWP